MSGLPDDLRSNLMRTMLSPLRSKPQPGKLRPSVDVFADIGNLTFDQLTNLRHRGAFTTVSLTFATCCQLVKYLDAMPRELPAGQTFLDAWYKVRSLFPGAAKSCLTQCQGKH